jgi:porphobilinogen synthase
VVQHSRDSLRKAAHEAVRAGVGGVMIFGVPTNEHKDPTGSAGLDPDGILNVAIRDVIEEVGDATVVMSDLCLDEFTSHGHCGVLAPDGTVDNDATLDVYGEMAVVQAAAGAHMVGPSGMMDGQIGAVRRALDKAGYQDTSVLAYSVKYAGAFYGPFREAVESTLQGDRRTYQQDPPNLREALREVDLDVAEGADIVMVKPALPYLDVVAAIRDRVTVPVAAYQVSGEYAMVEAAAANGWIDRERVILETLTSIKRAGAQITLTYWATEAAQLLRDRY